MKYSQSCIYIKYNKGTKEYYIGQTACLNARYTRKHRLDIIAVLPTHINEGLIGREREFIEFCKVFGLHLSNRT